MIQPQVTAYAPPKPEITEEQKEAAQAMRSQAQQLLRDAQELDGKMMVVHTHIHKHGQGSGILFMDRVPYDEDEESAVAQAIGLDFDRGHPCESLDFNVILQGQCPASIEMDELISAESPASKPTAMD